MSQEVYIRGSLALMMADLFPPLIQQAIMSDEPFAAGLNLSSVGTVTFNRAGPTFNRSALMAAVRAASRTPEGEITDEAGKTWKVVFDRNHDPLRLSLVGSPETIIASHLGTVSDNPGDRIAVLDAEAKRVNLPGGSRQNWSTILSKRALTEDEVGAFVLDVNATPTGVRAAIAGTLRDENVPFDVLVPRSLVYYERLVGCIGEQTTISQYADEVLAGHMAELLAWDPGEGMKQCLLLCAHPSVVEVLSQLGRDLGTYSHVVNWCANEGDAVAVRHRPAGRGPARRVG